MLHTRPIKSIELVRVRTIFTFFYLLCKLIRYLAVLWIFILIYILRVLLRNRTFLINNVTAFLVEVSFVRHIVILLIDSVDIVRIEVKVYCPNLFCEFRWTLIFVPVSESFHFHVKLVSSGKSGLWKFYNLGHFFVWVSALLIALTLFFFFRSILTLLLEIFEELWVWNLSLTFLHLLSQLTVFFIQSLILLTHICPLRVKDQRLTFVWNILWLSQFSFNPVLVTQAKIRVIKHFFVKVYYCNPWHSTTPTIFDVNRNNFTSF